ncbi:OmpA family protein [Yeosuana sp. AK3]
MKTSRLNFILTAAIVLFFVSIPQAEAQILNKLKKKAENAATRKLEKKTEEETNKAMDTILGNGKQNPKTDSPNSGNSGNQGNSSNNQTPQNAEDQEVVEMYSKSDWVAGENVILFEDFSKDLIGDFPQLWDGNASAEVITLSNNENQRWLKLFNKGFFEADMPELWGKDYTIEFDLLGFGISDNTSQVARLMVYLTDGSRRLNPGTTNAVAEIYAHQKWDNGINFRSIENNAEKASNSVKNDYRQNIKQGTHIALSVKGNRYRFYIDGEKVVDFPRGVPNGEKFKKILFQTYGMQDGKEHFLISNLRIAKGLPEPRAKLFATGKFVTNAIHFDVNSATIKPESFGILREIAEALKTEPNKNIRIVGHTDSDGTEQYNIGLSKDRSLSVKNALVNQFGIDANRLETDGKGEAEPVAPNDSALNKAKNRRTEFIVQ